MIRTGFLFALLLTTVTGLSAADLPWQKVVRERIVEFGHRNWIVVADSAYPAQASPGIETVVADTDQITALNFVMQTLAASGSITPNVYLDRELDFVQEDDATGVTAYRQRLSAALSGRKPSRIPHEEIIAKLDRAGATFRVLIIKTRLKTPYTSVFLQLDCAYWNDAAEARLRKAMAAVPARN